MPLRKANLIPGFRVQNFVLDRQRSLLICAGRTETTWLLISMNFKTYKILTKVTNSIPMTSLLRHSEKYKAVVICDNDHWFATISYAPFMQSKAMTYIQWKIADVVVIEELCKFVVAGESKQLLFYDLKQPDRAEEISIAPFKDITSMIYVPSSHGLALGMKTGIGFYRIDTKQVLFGIEGNFGANSLSFYWPQKRVLISKNQKRNIAISKQQGHPCYDSEVLAWSIEEEGEENSESKVDGVLDSGKQAPTEFTIKEFNNFTLGHPGIEQLELILDKEQMMVTTEEGRSLSLFSLSDWGLIKSFKPIILKQLSKKHIALVHRGKSLLIINLNKDRVLQVFNSKYL